MASEDQVRSVKQRHSAQLLQRPGVQGVGVEKDEQGQYVLAVHLNADAQADASQIPSEIDGVPVRLHTGGPFRKFAT